MKSLYDVLEVSEQASTEVIEAAYQRLTALHEKNIRDPTGDLEDNTNRLNAVNFAHALLGDPQKRQGYDEELASRRKPQAEFVSDGPLAGQGTVSLAYFKIAMLIAIPVVAIIYVVLNFLVDSGHVEVQEKTQTSEAAVRDEEVANDRLALDYRKEHDALVHERQSNELAAIQAIEAKRLEAEAEQLRYKNELYQEQLALQRLEQQRRALQMQYQANARARMLDMEQRQLDMAEWQVTSDRAYLEAARNDAQISRNVERIEKAIDLQRDINATKQGVSRRQYDAILDARR